MTEILNNIYIALSFTVIAGVLIFPKKKLFSRNNRNKQNQQRVLIEDALKYLYDCEYNNIAVKASGISKHLSVSEDNAAQLLERLEKMGLLISDENGYQLTGEGRSYALRVIRIHRLLEKYLADETGIEEKHWHKEAEKREHFVTPEEANELALKMGNPLYDPHGDPIPTVEGQLPEQKGFPLSSARPGELVQIIHIEDEPVEVYAQIAAEGLYSGMHVRLLESGNERVVFEANGEEIKLAPVFAAAISVAEIPRENVTIRKYKTLASLKQGETAEVTGISKACRGQQRRRLMDLGVVPGSIITAELVSTGGNPVAYKIRDALIALRRQHAEFIFVKDIEDR
jgi:DtxR family Mn-dependent transcriptional regulator